MLWIFHGKFVPYLFWFFFLLGWFSLDMFNAELFLKKYWQGQRSKGVGEYTSRYTVTTRMTVALRWAILMFQYLCWTVRWQCPQITTFEEESFCLPAQHFTDRPDQLDFFFFFFCCCFSFVSVKCHPGISRQLCN